ncbi:precorrin-3B synthase [Streptomyces sp. NPDC048172]|uniref:precorrin-3B synthase n=1 Tax=Streptomyces sp. NPDC048172 TaxID=3365505 RepID=UPI00371688DB
MSTAPGTPPLTSRDDGERGDACPGALRLHAADDGALARVRVPGGVLTVRQAEALAEAARRLGDGVLHLTSRGNVQLRGLAGGDACGTELAALLDAAGLLPSYAHERVRNVVASPLSGLDGRQGTADVRPWLTRLDALLCGSATAAALSGRFLFALDDGRGDVASLGADVTVRATEDGRHARVSVGTSAEALRVPYEDAPLAALTAAETFVEAARAQGGRVWRVAELPLSPDALVQTVAGRLPHAQVGTTDPLLVLTEGPAPGPHRGALSVHAPFGRLSPAQWRELTTVAEEAGEAGSGELRLTPWRGVVVPVPGVSGERAEALLARLAATGLVTDPASPWPGVSACVGRPGCAKSLADVRADAERSLAWDVPLLPVHWSGCERRCGHPPGDRTDVVAAGDGTYRVSVVRDGKATPVTPISPTP